MANGERVNGKTIGRTKPEADTSRVDDVAALEESARDGTLAPSSPRERALHIENTELRRQLAVMTARVSVMSMGGKAGSTAPIGHAHERLQAFEEKILSTAKMTDAAKLETLGEMVAAVKSYAERKAAHAAEVEAEVDREVGKDHSGPAKPSQWTDK